MSVGWRAERVPLSHCRRFLLEWMSFLHRYVPVGVLEVLPQRLNWRPPAFVGRSDLETWLASDKPADWCAKTVCSCSPRESAVTCKTRAFRVTSGDGVLAGVEHAGRQMTKQGQACMNDI